jgi:uncharacterized cupredoxin-like copper-binding protein
VRAIAFALLLAAQAPAAEVTVVLTDHHFRLDRPIEAGRMQWRVRNEGTEPHQALVVRLPDGVNEFQERAWIEHGRKGEEPAEPMGGATTVKPGEQTTFTTDLKPGKYLLICTMEEEEGRHYELGMIYRFTVE